MTNEQAIERLKVLLLHAESTLLDDKAIAIETVLNLLKEKDISIIEAKEANRQLSAEIQQKTAELAEKSAELEKKDKIISLMASYIAGLDIDEDICSKIENEDCDKMDLGVCENCLKQYFERKV